jgi:hypothetical protein
MAIWYCADCMAPPSQSAARHPDPESGNSGVDAALCHVEAYGLVGHDVHVRTMMLYQGRGLIVAISDFLCPETCRAWDTAG